MAAGCAVRLPDLPKPVLFAAPVGVPTAALLVTLYDRPAVALGGRGRSRRRRRDHLGGGQTPVDLGPRGRLGVGAGNGVWVAALTGGPGSSPRRTHRGKPVQWLVAVDHHEVLTLAALKCPHGLGGPLTCLRIGWSPGAVDEPHAFDENELVAH